MRARPRPRAACVPNRLAVLRPATAVALLGAVALVVGCRRAPVASCSDTLTLAVRADVTGFFPNPPIVDEGYTLDINLRARQ